LIFAVFLKNFPVKYILKLRVVFNYGIKRAG
jgi:hypothetical protein